MSSGRKRYRPSADTSLQDEDDFRSSKFVKLRNRTRAPVKHGRSTITANASAGTSFKNTTRNNSTIGNYQGRGSFGNGEGRGRKYAHASFSSMFTSSKTDGNDDHVDAKGSPNPSGRTETTTPRKSQKFKRNQAGSAEKFAKKGPKPTTSYGLQTPEFMKIKEDDSLLQEKKEKRRYRNQIMRLRTAKGQPVMRGRIQLMLEQIKASTSQG